MCLHSALLQWRRVAWSAVCSGEPSRAERWRSNAPASGLRASSAQLASRDSQACSLRAHFCVCVCARSRESEPERNNAKACDWRRQTFFGHKQRGLVCCNKRFCMYLHPYLHPLSVCSPPQLKVDPPLAAKPINAKPDLSLQS